MRGDPHLLHRSALSLCLALAPALLPAAPLQADEQVLFMPGTARPIANGRLEVDVHAWLYEKERRRGMNWALARYLSLDLRALSPAARLRFNQRTALFHTESEDDKVIDLVVEGRAERSALPRTADSGRSNVRLVMDAAAITPAEDAPVLNFHALTRRADLRRFRGYALVVPAEGLSVVSDIDDTIKHTQVRDRREMLLNTFTRRFEPVEGMAAQYRALAAQPGTRFHYVSASPIQLYSPLADFLREAALPVGSVHLRESTTWRTLVPGEGDSRDHKLAVIGRLMADFPLRRFLLVGDSGEADPEIYAEVARTHPNRVQGIVIRDVTGEARETARYRNAFNGLDAGLWHILPSDGTGWPASAR